MAFPSISLRLLGGETPAFAAALHVGRPNVPDPDDVLRRVRQSLDNLWLSNNGPLVQEFERRIAEMLGVRHCVCLCNATIGLEILARAVGLSGEVVVPSYTFVATAHALAWLGITPVFADIDERTHNLDPASVAAAITPRTSAIWATHLWGRACEVEALQAVADRAGLPLFFDAAHAFGCTHGGRWIGRFGRAEVFSFHATKFLNAFEGGAITTDDAELAARIRRMVTFGFQGYDNVIDWGTNGKMTEASAAMGLSNLAALDRIIDVNRRNEACYRRCLADIPGTRLIDYVNGERSNFQYIVLEWDGDLAGLTRDEVVEVLHSENILARRYFWPGCHGMPVYRDAHASRRVPLPATERVAAKVIVLPTGITVSPEMIERVAEVIRQAVRHAARIREALRSRPPHGT